MSVNQKDYKLVVVILHSRQWYNNVIYWLLIYYMCHTNGTQTHNCKEKKNKKKKQTRKYNKCTV